MDYNGRQHFEMPEGAVMKSSPQQVRDFMETSIWSDIVVLLAEHKEYLTNRLVRAETIEEVRGLQYSIDEMNEMLNLPNRIIVCIEEQKEIETQKQKQK